MGFRDAWKQKGASAPTLISASLIFMGNFLFMEFECVINAKGQAAIFSPAFSAPVSSCELKGKSLILHGDGKVVEVAIPDLFRKTLLRRKRFLLVECKSLRIYRETFLTIN